jgi:hypothetical protein
MSDIQLLQDSEIRTVQGGTGITGRVGVLYQSITTGKSYQWDPVNGIMSVAGGLSTSQVSNLVASGISNLSYKTAQKIIQTASAAKGNNEFELGPWRAHDAWAATTVYRPGQVVAKGGYIYLLFSGSSGPFTSGTTGATWTNTTSAYQVDGTCVWQFLGADPTPTTLVGAPTAVFSSQPTAATYATGLGLTKVSTDLGLLVNIATAQTQAYFSQTFAQDPGYAPGTAQLSAPSAGIGSARTSNNTTNFIEFETEADRVICQGGQLFFFAGSGNILVTVNNRRVYASYNATNNFNGGAANVAYAPTIDIDLSGLPPNSTKRIRVYSRGFLQSTQYIFVKPQFDIRAPTYSTPWKLAIEGDSLSQSGNNVGLSPFGYDFGANLAARLGASAVMNNSVGGTGVNANGGTATNFPDRLYTITNYNPDVLVIASTHNGTPTTAAAIAYINQVRAALPNTLIFVGGAPLLRADVSSTTLSAAEAPIQAASASFATDPMVKFIPYIGDTVPWFVDNGAGNGFSPTGGGIGDRIFYVSGTLADAHPTWTGYDYLAARLSAAVLAKCRSIVGG